MKKEDYIAMEKLVKIILDNKFDWKEIGISDYSDELIINITIRMKPKK